MTKQIIINDRVYIPEELVSEEDLEQNYVQYVYNEQRCSNCGQTPSIKNSLCERCQQPDEIVTLWSKAKDKKGNVYYAVPSGHISRVQKVLGVDFSKYKVKDRRACPELSHKIKWKGKLRQGEIIEGRETPDQKKIVRQWMKKKNGLVKAPPRTGKTVVLVNLICKLQTRTLIVAHQEELLKNFLKTFKGDDDKPAMTNVPQIERQTGQPVVGIVENIEDIDKYDIALVTYQKFISKYGTKRIKKYLINKFGLVLVDEAHQANAFAYSKFLNQLNPKYKGGCTATPERKDCIEGETLVLTDRGYIKARELYYSEDNEKILSWNSKNKNFEYKEIAEKHVRKNSNLVKIEHEQGLFYCTPDHEIWSNDRNNYVKAKDLKLDEDIGLPR